MNLVVTFKISCIHITVLRTQLDRKSTRRIVALVFNLTILKEFSCEAMITNPNCPSKENGRIHGGESDFANCSSIASYLWLNQDKTSNKDSPYALLYSISSLNPPARPLWKRPSGSYFRLASRMSFKFSSPQPS